MKTVRFLLPAELEMLDAAHYYGLHSPGLGIDFINKIGSAIQDISQNPEQWPIVRPLIRRRIIHRFPYCLLYRIDPDEILILATMHMRRHPDYWINR